MRVRTNVCLKLMVCISMYAHLRLCIYAYWTTYGQTWALGTNKHQWIWINMNGKQSTYGVGICKWRKYMSDGDLSDIHIRNQTFIHTNKLSVTTQIRTWAGGVVVYVVPYLLGVRYSSRFRDLYHKQGNEHNLLA